MLTKSLPLSTQTNLFHAELFSQLESKDPLIQLANTIDWAIFDNAFAKYYSKDNGAPSGVKEVLAAKIILPKKALKRDNRYQRDKKRKLCKR